MSIQQEQRILVATVAAYQTPPESSRWLIESAKRFGIELTIIGQGETLTTLYQKTAIVARYLQQHPEYQYVLFVDFRDVIFCASLPEMFEKYRAIGHEVVAAAERRPFPLVSLGQRSPETGTSYRFLNSGTIFSTASAWLKSWQWMQCRKQELAGQPPEIGLGGLHIFNDDQAAWMDLCINGELDIAVDSRCAMFQPLATIDWDLGSGNADLNLEGRRVVNRETGARPCLIHANGGAPVDAWGRYVLNPASVWIWQWVDLIRQVPARSLLDEDVVTDLILKLGLHEGGVDGYCDHHRPFAGRGLSIWQQPREFARYLCWLAVQPPIRSYLEIGVAQGGSFITTIEYLRRFHPTTIAVGLDPCLSEPVQAYVQQTQGVHFVNGDRGSGELTALLDRIGGIDLTMIDGEHTASAARLDWELARSYSRYVSFHDVQSMAFEVRHLWREVQSSYRRSYDFSDRETNPGAWGIGLVDLAYGN